MSYLPSNCYMPFEFYMPRYKWDFLQLLRKLYPNDKSFSGMRKNQLKAIYISARRKGVTSDIGSE